MFVALNTLIPGGSIDSRAKVNRGVSIDTLANSIKQLGLILPLSVIKDGEKWRVVDGNRRLAALKLVHKGDKDAQVPVLEADADIATARAMSLAANVERLPLHPVDQYEAFAAIAAEGKALEDIAAAFGINVRQVSQRMALGSLHVSVRQLYREGVIDADTAATMTKLTLQQQEDVAAMGLPGWRIRETVRDMASTYGIRYDSAAAKFVSRETYKKAGGTFANDLFVEPGEEDWLDAPLLNGLVEKKINAIFAGAVEDGWSFTTRTDKWIGNDYVFVEPEGVVELALEKQAELASLEGRKAILDALIDKSEETEEELADPESGEVYDMDAIFEESREVDRAIEAINEERQYFTPEQKAKLGVVIDNRYEVHYGLTPRAGATTSPEGAALEEKIAKAKEEGDGISAALLADLNGHLTNAAKAALADHSLLALKLLLIQLIGADYSLTKGMTQSTGVSIKLSNDRGPVTPTEHGKEIVEALLKAVNYSKAKTLEQKLDALLNLDVEQLLKILAWFVGQSLNQINRSSDLTTFLYKANILEPRAHWTPDVENFFGRVSKAHLQKIADQAKLKVDLGPLKKAEAANKLMLELPETWLPEAIRPKKK